MKGDHYHQAINLADKLSRSCWACRSMKGDGGQQLGFSDHPLTSSGRMEKP